MTDNLPVVIQKEGRGHTGFCKICASSLAPQINKMYEKGDTTERILKWMKEAGMIVARRTLYNHRDHLKDPRQTFVEVARKNPLIKRVTTRDFLEAIRDTAMANAQVMPELITVDHGLKAAQIMLQDKKGIEGITLVLMKVFTGGAEEVIEGEYKDVTEVK